MNNFHRSLSTPNGSVGNSFQMLTDAPLCQDWNKENASPMVIGDTDPSSSPSCGLSGLGSLLKRPLATVAESGEEQLNHSASSFKIKRRRGLTDRAVTTGGLGNVDLSGASVGSSPSLSNPATPVRRFALPTAPSSSSSFARPQQQQQRRPTLQRWHSENNAAHIMRSCQLADSTPDLTGDFAKALSLPLLKTGLKHQDLNTIDCHTLAKLVRGEFGGQKRVRIIDARYVYEFDGGHVRGAENFGKWDEEKFFGEFLPGHLKAKGTDTVAADGDILVFHCEFSSVRGPALMRDLRKKDRCLNKDTYPALHYPECYLLHNGYKEFHEHYPELCDPQGCYQPMNDPNFSSEEKMFRKKAKSWAAGGSVARTVGGSSRLLNL